LRNLKRKEILNLKRGEPMGRPGFGEAQSGRELRKKKKKVPGGNNLRKGNNKKKKV